MKRLYVALTLVMAMAFALPSPASAAIIDKSCEGITDSAICKAKGEKVDGSNGILKTIVDTLLLVVGFLSVAMIIFGGIKYMTSSGDSAKLTAAKNTILYAAIGLVVAVCAFAIVSWIVGEASKVAS